MARTTLPLLFLAFVAIAGAVAVPGAPVTEAAPIDTNNAAQVVSHISDYLPVSADELATDDQLPSAERTFFHKKKTPKRKRKICRRVCVAYKFRIRCVVKRVCRKHCRYGHHKKRRCCFHKKICRRVRFCKFFKIKCRYHW